MESKLGKKEGRAFLTNNAQKKNKNKKHRQAGWLAGWHLGRQALHIRKDLRANDFHKAGETS